MLSSSACARIASPVRLGKASLRALTSRKGVCVRIERWERRRLRSPGRNYAEGVGVGASAAVAVQGTPIDSALPEASPVPEGQVLEQLESVKEIASDPTQQLGQSLTDLTSSVTQSTGNALQSAKQLSNRATENATESLRAASDAVSASVDGLTKELQSSVEVIQQQVNALGNDLNESLQSTLQTLEGAIQQLQAQVLDAAPPEVKETIEAAQPYLQNTLDFAVAYRFPLAIAFISLTGFVGFSYYNARFVGYSGAILPSKVLELLESNAPALLVDIRSQAAQEREGVPKLRRRALGKVIPISLVQVDPRIRGTVEITPQLNSDVTAAYIAGHRQAANFTNFVIMAETEAQGRRVARSLRSLDCVNAFVMLGGFAAWREASLPVTDSADYDLTPIDVLSDKATDLTVPLADPSNLIPASLGVVAIAWAIWNYHYVLQLLGILCPTIGFTVYLLKKYDAPKELLDDAERFLARFAAQEETQATPQSTQAVQPEEEQNEQIPPMEPNETATAES